MKKLVVLFLLLLWPAMAARGETWTIDSGENHAYSIETFAGTLPEEMQQVLASTPFAEDACLCGVLINEANKTYPDVYHHVVLPEEEGNWHLAASGTFGYVRVSDVKEYATLVNMEYGVAK